MADTYEQNLAQKSAVTISDYVRLVGTDNVSYKQPIHSMCAPYANPSGTDLLSVVKALNQGTYFYRMDNVSGFPETGGVVFRIVKTHGTNDARASILAVPMNANANIYTAYNTSASASSITWTAQPTRAEITPTSANLTAGTNITFATDFDNKATKTGHVVCVVFNLAPSTAIDSGAVLATIPSGYRPSKQIRSTCYFSDGYARFAVNANGEIVALTNASSGKYFMGAITYII